MERTVSVKLTAQVSQYQAAMAAATKSTTGLSESAGGLNKLGSQLQAVGANMTRSVTVPLVALGAGAVAMAGKFETSFAQMVGLANVPAGEVDALKESVLGLAGETAVAPQDLADALYFAASAGLDASEAMDAVSIAAHASAAGMGSTADNVNLITTAMAAYGHENITAAQAADILTATIREGKADPRELAASLGTVLPIAAQMGISFAEVGGATAYMSNIFGSAEETTVRLNGVLRSLMDPSEQGRKALEQMGTSADELKAAIAQDGLMGALQLLRDHGFAGNSEALHNLFEDSRAMQGATVLLNDATGTLDQTMSRVAGSAGSLDTAFDAVSDTSAFKMKQAFNDIKVALTEVGAVLLPFAAKAAGVLSDLIGWFSDLPAPVQNAALAMAALAAAGGPVLMIAGNVMKSWSLLNTTFGATLGSTNKAVSALSGIAVAAGVALAAWKILDQGHVNATGHIDTAAGALQRATEQAWLEAAAAAGATGDIDALAVAHQALGQAILEQADGKLSEWFSALNVSGDMALDTLINLKEWGGSNAHAQEFLADALGLTVQQMDMLSSIVHTGFEEGDITQEMRDGLGMTNEQIMAVGGALVGLQGYAIENTSELDDMARASLDATVALGGAGRAAVIAAEGIAGSRRETGNAVDVYEEYIHQLTLIDPEAAAAAVSVDELGGAVGAASGEVSAAGPLWANLWTSIGDGGKQLGVVTGGAKEASQALSQFADGIHNAAEAQAALNAISSTEAGAAWVERAAEVARFTTKGGDALTVYQTLLSLLNNAAPAFATFVKGQIGLSDAFQKVLGTVRPATKAVGDFIDGAGGFSKIGDAARAATSNLQDLIDEMFSAEHAMDAASMAADTFRGRVESLLGPSDRWRAATRDVYTEIDAMSDALDDNGTTLDMNKEKGRENQVQLERTRDAILEHGAALLGMGLSADAAAADIAYNTEQLNEQWRQAGYTEREIALMNLQYGLIPSQVTTYIELLGDKTANGQIGAYISNLKTIPPSTSTAVNAYPTGVESTKGQINSLTAPRSVAITPYLTQSSFAVQLYTKSAPVYLKSAAGRFIPGGSNLLTTTAEVGGRRGDEVILPLGDKARMAQLLAMSQVGPRVAAAFGDVKLTPAAGGVGGSSGGGGSLTQSITVNMPPGANGDDVVRALRQYQRRTGAVPIATR